MSARISVDLESPVPPYEQIRGQVSALAASGVLSPGDRLPTIRMLAADLGVAPGTVARAYKELEAEGTVTAMRRRGTVIAPPRPDAAPAHAIPPELTAAVENLVTLARRHGISGPALLHLMGTAMRSSPGDEAPTATTLEQ
ncbi:GntR family transcriptional regulator [Arthrobacter sp. Sa2CUA1]|uniref:GntR family transcriptional regulator n=1 Tax=Arthrobacter gallicola TaxID=2762225 RepID=A0ABR8URC1_9MICC|nr:GntR family transcriptional regulator [Arthrobacter gallicola]MBD7995114.1 GntR family transcriptional regulator [Arthrobacter gallicola]